MAASTSEQLISVAPMMDWTDVHYRQLARLMSKQTWLWTEMVVDKTIIHTATPDAHLWFPPEQHPIVLQMGGSDPAELRRAAARVAPYNYDEINLNCGCPSDRVASAGCFGASMMLRPMLVAECVTALHEGCPGTPITVKCRIGVDDVDSYAALCSFVATVAEHSPVRHFIVHSRKCLLKGLSPHQNRSIPKLRYGWVYALKRDFPHLTFTLNGGIQSPHEVKDILGRTIADSKIYGVMIGRAAFNSPWQTLSQADSLIYGAPDPAKSRRQVVEEYCKYGDAILGKFGCRQDGSPMPNVRAVIKPILNLFHGVRRSKRWKSSIDAMLLKRPTTVSGVLLPAMSVLEDEFLDHPPGVYLPDFAPESPFTCASTGVWPPDDVPPPFGLEPRPSLVLPAAEDAVRSEVAGAPCAAPSSSTPAEPVASARSHRKRCASDVSGGDDDAACSGEQTGMAEGVEYERAHVRLRDDSAIPSSDVLLTSEQRPIAPVASPLRQEQPVATG